MYYEIYCKKSETIYGINYERGSNPLDINKIYKELHIAKFKEEEWKFGPLEKGWMPLYYETDLNFKNLNVYKKFLIDQIDEAISQIGNQMLRDFTPDIQKFIIQQLKASKVI